MLNGAWLGVAVLRRPSVFERIRDIEEAGDYAHRGHGDENERIHHYSNSYELTGRALAAPLVYQRHMTLCSHWERIASCDRNRVQKKRSGAL